MLLPTQGKRWDHKKNAIDPKRRDYIVSDTGVNISIRLLDQILHGSSSHWWYRSESWLLRLYMSHQLALLKNGLPLLPGFCRKFLFICMNSPPPPFFWGGEISDFRPKRLINCRPASCWKIQWEFKGTRDLVLLECCYLSSKGWQSVSVL